MQSSLFDLEQLPEKAAAVAAQVPTLAFDLVSISLDRIVRARHHWPESLFLAKFQVNWHFYLARRGKKVIFFFWKKDLPERLVLDATLNLTVVPTESFGQGLPVSLESIAYRFVLPPFVSMGISDERFAIIAPTGARPSDTIVFEFGPGEQDLLAIRHPEKGIDGAELRYTCFGKTQDIQSEEVGNQKLWRPQPFIAMIDAIRAWVTGGAGDILAMRPPDESVRSDAWKMLLQIAGAYIQSSRVIRKLQPPEAKSGLIDELGVKYDLGPFESRIILRLKPGGEIAVKDEDDPFHLRMAIAIQRERRGVSAQVEVRPPDFLAAGALRDAFIDKLEGALQKTASALRVHKNQARVFLRETRDSAVVFRVKRRRDLDTDVLVLNGTLNGTRAVAMLRADFIVEAAQDPPVVELQEESLKALFVGPAYLDVPALSENVVAHLLRLAAEIHNWLAVLS